MRVHILVTVLSSGAYSRLVFKTLRKGFPTSEIKVWLNETEFPNSDIHELCKVHGYALEETHTTHHEWIRRLALTEKDPFWICDTDIIFYDSVEEHTSPSAICGWRIPEWLDEFTGCVTRPRLHTSLMLINPKELQREVESFRKSFHEVPFIDPLAELFAPLVVPVGGVPYFYDVCALLYNAIDGESFTDAMKDRYFHFNFGTIENLVLPKLKDGEKMRSARQFVLDHPQVGMGAWRAQEEYYKLRQYAPKGHEVIESISAEDAKLAHVWNQELCRGNPDAMAFCDLWHHYCHAIDDLIDTMQDGRPIMSQDQIIGIFFHAALLYNCTFYMLHREMLFPIVLQITNTYADSVAWEKASGPHLRAMADVLRTVGGEMYFMVALLCGGQEHMRTMSRRIRERDWLSQHNE